MMRMYKLIATDMDGTLLNSVGEISPKNLDYVKKAIDHRVEFAIVTGRPYISVKGFLKSSSLSCSVIGCNGAQVTGSDGKLVKAGYMNKDSLLKVMGLSGGEDVYYQIYDDYYIYTRSRLQFIRMLKHYSTKSIKRQITPGRIINGFRRLFFTEVKVIDDLRAFAAREDRNFYKIQISSDSQPRLNEIREKLKPIPDIDVTSSSYFNIEIGPKGVTKGTALRDLAAFKKIPASEVIAIGDNYNDIPMLLYAGCGVAMENAVQAAKDIADFCTKANDDDGVAYAIEKLIFGNCE